MCAWAWDGAPEFYRKFVPEWQVISIADSVESRKEYGRGAALHKRESAFSQCMVQVSLQERDCERGKNFFGVEDRFCTTGLC
jgi:hypothetical protein